MNRAVQLDPTYGAKIGVKILALVSKGLVLCLLPLMLSGCLAQKADMKRMRGDFDKRFTDLDQREKNLNDKIAEALGQIEKQGRKAEQGVREARARLKHDISQLNEKVGSLKEGELAEQAHRVRKLAERVDNMSHQNESLSQLMQKQKSDVDQRFTQLEQSQSSQFSKLKADQVQFHTKLDDVQENLRGDMAKAVSRVEALGPTLESLAQKMDVQLDQQDQSITSNQDHMEQQLAQLEAQNRVLHKRVGQLGKALPEFKNTLAAFGQRLVEEDEKVADLTQRVTGQSSAMRSKLNTDTKNVAVRLNALIKKVDADMKAITTHLGEITSKVDRDLKANSAHLDKVTMKVDEDGKAMAGHLAEVNKSVTSVAQALRTMSATILDRVDNQDRRFEKMIQALKRVTSEVNNIRGASGQARGSKSKALSQKSQKKLSTASASGSGSQQTDTEQRMMRQQALSQYEEVMAVFKQGSLDQARQGFTEFLMTYPSSSRAPNAQYWLAECLYGSQQFEKAIGAYQQVEQRYPNSEKVPAAVLKQGFAYLALNNRAEARSNLERVVQLFPTTPEASQASERLRQLQASP